MNLHYLYRYRPQLSKEQYGPEPSLMHLVQDYYLKAGWSLIDSETFTKQYFDKLSEEFSE